MSKYQFILSIQLFSNMDLGTLIYKVDSKVKISEYIASLGERPLRKKYPYTFTLYSIDYFMKYFGIRNIIRYFYLYKSKKLLLLQHNELLSKNQYWLRICLLGLFNYKST